MSTSATNKRILGAVRGAHERWQSDAWLDKQTRQRQSDHIIARCFAMITLLAEYEDGLSSENLAEALGLSRPTVDRDLISLRTAGVRLDKIRNGSFVRHVLKS